MDKKGLAKKNQLVIVGGARGAGKFAVVGKIIDELEDFEALNTGKAILDISKSFGFSSLDEVRLMDYYRFIEPALLAHIKTLLRLKNLVIESHYHYTTPGLTMSSLRELAGQASSATLILVETAPKDIYLKNKGSGLEWYKDIKNIEKDVIANSDYFRIYTEIMGEKTSVNAIRLTPESFNIAAIIDTIRKDQRSQLLCQEKSSGSAALTEPARARC